jgi:hypothetical protein
MGGQVIEGLKSRINTVPSGTQSILRVVDANLIYF